MLIIMYIFFSLFAFFFPPYPWWGENFNNLLVAVQLVRAHYFELLSICEYEFCRISWDEFSPSLNSFGI